MIKVLVYGGRESARRIARFLEKEMPVEAETLIPREEFLELSTAGIVEETENDLYPLIGKKELIGLADPLGAVAAKELMKNWYPKQKFVGYGQGIAQVVKKLKSVYVLVTLKIRRLEIYQRFKAECQQTEIRETDGEEWKELIEDKWASKEEIMEKVRSAQGAPILPFHPKLPCYKIREIVDWRNEVIDMEAELLKAIKTELGLKKWY